MHFLTKRVSSLDKYLISSCTCCQMVFRVKWPPWLYIYLLVVTDSICLGQERDETSEFGRKNWNDRTTIVIVDTV